MVTTAVPALRPLRVTADIKVCGTQLPDEAIAVGAGGVLANAVVTLTGVKVRTPYPDPQVTNEKCRFVPRVQLARAGRPDEDHEQGSRCCTRPTPSRTAAARSSTSACRCPTWS